MIADLELSIPHAPIVKITADSNGHDFFDAVTEVIRRSADIVDTITFHYAGPSAPVPMTVRVVSVEA